MRDMMMIQNVSVRHITLSITSIGNSFHIYPLSIYIKINKKTAEPKNFLLLEFEKIFDPILLEVDNFEIPLCKQNGDCLFYPASLSVFSSFIFVFHKLSLFDGPVSTYRIERSDNGCLALQLST
jgi:hypothetical protein